MIRLKQLTLFQGSKNLLDAVDLTLYADHKVGIVGHNGCGKSSLFQLLMGHLAPEQGELEVPARWQISAARQDTPPSDLNSVDYVLSGHHEYSRLTVELAQAQSDGDGERIGLLHGKLEAINGWALPAQAAKLLTGLSFSEAQMQSPVQALSGGWRMRLNLAQALIQPADLLLLDEPTNHLDLEAVLWLQAFLRNYNGMLLTISHDRDFLDTFTNHIIHFQNQKLHYYTGNYSTFEREKQLKETLQQAQYEKQAKQIEHLEKFITRFKAKASKATQAQSRVKALEKMDRVHAVQIRAQFSFEFLPIKKDITELVDLDQVSVGYGNSVLLSGINMRISAGQRIGLLGRNGQGKSTLIKLICGELTALDGLVTRTKHFKAGYFAQHQVEQLNLDQSPLWHIQSMSDEVSEQTARTFLGGFAFHGDKALDKVAGFSGGEKARLVLAMITWQAPNVLLLDEPTNHFDIEMREALALALQEYQGAVILVAHDKNLLESVVDEFWLVNEGKVSAFRGDLQDYQKWLQDYCWRDKSRDNEVLQNDEVKEHSAKNKKEQKRIEAEKRKLLAPLKNRLKNVESELAGLEKKKSELESQLADNALYEESEKGILHQVMQSVQVVNQSIEALEQEWLELSEQLESHHAD
jgi:ATP-binding cassette subfamily F protein 3